MICVDAHVHVYDCFDTGVLFDSAWDNFERLTKRFSHGTDPRQYVLMMAEGHGEDWFQRHREAAFGHGSGKVAVGGNWTGRRVGHPAVLQLVHREAPERQLFLIEGYQLVSEEKIEILSLCSSQRVADGAPLSELIRLITTQDAIPVLPWGAGKWMGKRGRIVRDIFRARHEPLIYLADSGGRPWIWPTPSPFSAARRNGLPLLSGSDPLPLHGEVFRVGSFGWSVPGNTCPPAQLPVFLKRVIMENKQDIRPFGRLQKTATFVLNQLRLQVALRGKDTK